MGLEIVAAAKAMEITAKIASKPVETYFDRIRVKKESKKKDELVAVLEEIVSELIDDRRQLIQAAQELQDEAYAGQISDDDIAYISDQVLPILSETFGLGEKEKSSFSILLSPEVLSTLKRLGFRYKDAIGDPLTELTADAIRKLGQDRLPRAKGKE